MKKLWIFLVRCFGWKFNLPTVEEWPELKRCVIIMAPHTCIDDFFVGAASVWKIGLNAKIFMKDSFSNWFTDPILRWAGVVCIDRGNKNNHLVSKAVELFEQEENLTIVVTPEGTRKPVKRWKRGFYEIATQAHVPIALSTLDYKSKTATIKKMFYPTGDFNADMIEIMKLYQDANAKYPELFNKSDEGYRRNQP